MKNKFIYILLFALLSASYANAQEQLTLEKAISIGLKQNFDIAISKQQTNVADMANTWGMAGRYPTISLGASTLYNSAIADDASSLNSDAGVNFNWVLFGGMRVTAKKSILNLQYDLAKGSEQLQVENSIKSIILGYYSVLIEQRLMELNADVLKLSEDRYKREKVAYSIGGTDTYALVQAESAYLSDQKQNIQQQRMVNVTIYQLNSLLNVDTATEWTFDTELPIPNVEYSLPLMKDMMLSNNKTIKNQYINQRISEENIKQAQSAIYPTVSIMGEAAYRGAYQRVGGISTNTDAFGLGIGASVNFNLYNGGVVKRNIQISKLNNEISETASKKMEQFLITQLFRSYDAYNYNREIVALGEKEVKASKISLDLSYEKFTNGTISSFDFRQVQLAYLQTVYSQMKYTSELINANAELVQLIGGLVSDYETE